MASSKSKNFEWNIETTKTLISLYEENECLYNNLAPDYKNREKRWSIMASFAKVISDITGRLCLVADVRKKINSLRSQYLAEKLKITKCKSGSGANYIPTAYWFPLLRFLDISSEADVSLSNLDSESTQVDCGSMDTQQSQEKEFQEAPRRKTKRNSSSAQDEDEDNLIKEATATMRQMSQQITNNIHTNNQNHITAFCNFINSELTNILEASNNNLVNKAKRKIQMCLFEIWDEVDDVNLCKERPSMRTTNSYDFINSQIIPTEISSYDKLPVPSTSKCTNIVTGTASSLIVRKNNLLSKVKAKKLKIENVNKEDDVSVDHYHINKLQGDGNCNSRMEENNMNLLNSEPTEKSNEKIVYFINNCDPEVILTHTLRK